MPYPVNGKSGNKKCNPNKKAASADGLSAEDLIYGFAGNLRIHQGKKAASADGLSAEDLILGFAQDLSNIK